MKKTNSIVLGSVLLASVAMHACSSSPRYEDDWLYGDVYSDTVINKQIYRQYHAYWYPVYNGYINPGMYHGYSINAIRQPSFRQGLIPESERIPYGSSPGHSYSGGRGGFGHSSHAYGGGHAGGFGG